MLLYEFPQALDINTCHRTIVCNTCEVMHMSGGMLNADEDVLYKYEYQFTGSFFKKAPIIIDDNTKMKLLKMQKTPETNIDEKMLNNPINENTYEKRY